MQYQYLSIGVNDNAENIVQQIDKELAPLKEKSFNYSINEIDFEGTTSVICNIENDNEAKQYELFIYHVSNALAEHVISEYEGKLLIRIINSNYGYFNSSEKKDILRISQKNIRNDDNVFFNTLFQIRRRNMIVKKFMEYFETSSSLILDGFINFRLKDYIKELEDVIDDAVDDFLIEREYREFIRLLKYFVEIQESKFNIIHVIMHPDEQYVLLDEKKHEITNECMQDFLYELPETEINQDDLLVSSLITLAPKNIVIHNSQWFKNKKLLDTIKNIFSDKVNICEGCSICEYNLVKLDTKE